jgi:hypothetical protein
MYYSRTGSIFDFILYLVMCVTWWSGGWLIVTHSFRLPSRERLLGGLATGWLLFIAVSNLLAHFLPLTPAYWLASLLILGGGLLIAWTKSRRGSSGQSWIDFRDLKSWPQIAWVGGLTVLFELIQRGLAIFDDYVHLPMTSTVAAGDIPPHFYVDPAYYFAYHYGLHLSAGALMRIGGLFPWSAWDLSKAFAIAMTLGLGWLWISRVTRSSLAGFLGGFLFVFGSGTRWLLLIIPNSLLSRISGQIQMINTGKDTADTFLKAMLSPWASSGGGPIPFPFAYHNGIFPPVHMVLGSNGALPFVAPLLMLVLVYKRRFTLSGTLAFTLVFAVLALSGEHVFVFLWGGIALAMLIYLVQSRLRRASIAKEILLPWVFILLGAGILSITQGAYLTEAARSILASLQGAASSGSNNFYGFSLRWPPAAPDAHLAPLSIFNPSQLIVLLAELGPALLLSPFVTVYFWRSVRAKDWMKAGLSLGAAVSFVFSILFQYGSDRSTTRLTQTSLWIWLVLGFPLLWFGFRKAGSFIRFLIGTGYGLTVFAGIVLFAIQVLAIGTPQLSYFITPADAATTRLYWDRLPKSAQVLDSNPERSVTIFGRASRARPWFYVPYPDWQALIANPDPSTVARAGYSYIYIVPGWMKTLTEQQQSAFKQPCVSLVYDNHHKGDENRLLYDVSKCK